MPGVFGLVCRSSSTQLSARLSAMSGRMSRQPWYGESSYFDPSGHAAVGLITRTPEDVSELHECAAADSIVVALEGDIYDYAVHRRSLEAKGCRFESESRAELLAHGFAARGLAFFRDLHGKFTAAMWDARTSKLHLVNDRFGMKPMHYAHGDGRFSFGSELKALLADPAVSKQTNLRGVAQFFTFGQLLGEDTLFEGIHLLPASGWLTYDVDTDRVSVGRYWRLQGKLAAERPIAESLDRIDAAFAASVERMTTDTKDLGLSLSGGLDARTLLGVIGSGKPLSTLCMGMAGSMDHRSAAEMASLLGYPHRQVILDEEFLTSFESHLRNMVRLTDGQYLCQCIVMPTLPIYREMGVKVLLRGHAGELMHMTKAYNFSIDQAALQLHDEPGLFDWLWRHLQSFMLGGTEGRLFAKQYRAAIEELARESLLECVRQTEGTEPVSHRIWQLFFEQRSRRETALSLVEFESVVETRLPYLDNELVEELMAAPPELKLGDTIQSYILRRRQPEFLNVINVNTGARVGASRFTKIVAKARQKVLAKLGWPGYQPYERLGLWLRRELRPLVRRLLLSDRFLGRGLFDPNAVRAVVEDHLEKRKNHTYLLLALMVYEVGQQEIVDRSSSASQLALAV